MPASRSSVAAAAFALALACVALPALATEAEGASWFLEAGRGEDSVRAVSLGAAWALPWRDVAAGITTHMEAFVSAWRTPRPDGACRSLLQIGAVPTVRLRLGSPWFLDAGIGLSLLDGGLSTAQRTFSTRLNFSDNLALGRSFGGQGGQEVSLHLQHTSNAGMSRPNPGLDLLMLRYAQRF